MVSSVVGGKLLGTLNFQTSCLFLVTSTFLSPQSGFQVILSWPIVIFSSDGKLGLNTLLGIHTEETRIERDTYTTMFIAALFTTARTWKQPRCPLADEWIKKLWYIYTMEYSSAINKNTFESVLMRWVKLEPIIQSEVSQKEKHQYSILAYISRI